MKSRIYVFGLVLTFLFSLSACKSKESSYKKVYEAAKSRPTVYVEEQPVTTSRNTVTTVTPAPAPRATPAPAATFQTERITAVDGSGIKQYSVVIGSFINKTNAESLKSRMRERGYSPILAQNEKNMYRVIVATFADKSDAIIQRDAIRETYPEFSDAWLLDRAY
jgi:cell division septation protein DedD